MGPLAEISSGATKILVIITVCSILGIGAFFRLYHLGTAPILEDEAYHTVVAHQWAQTGQPYPPSGKFYPRGFPLIALETLALTYLPFEMETSVRLPAALFGVLNIWLLYLIGNRNGGFAVGLLCASAFALSGYAINYAKMARMYEMLATAGLLSLLFFERFIESGRWRHLIYFVVALCFAVTAHQLGIFLGGLPLAGIIIYWRHRSTVIKLSVAICCLLAFYLIYNPALHCFLPDMQTSPEVASQEDIPLLILPSLEHLQLAWSTTAWIWVIGSLAAGLSTFFYYRRYKAATPYNSWAFIFAVVIIVSGILSFAFVSFIVLLIGLILLWSLEDSFAQRYSELLLLGFSFGLVLIFWIVISLFLAFEQVGLPVNGIMDIEFLKNSLSTFIAYMHKPLNYPKVHQRFFLPLINSVDAISYVFFGGFCTVVFFSKALFNGSFFESNRPLVRILFLIIAATGFGIAQSYYTHERYLYFLFPFALLTICEGLIILWKAGKKKTKIGLTVMVLLFFGTVQIPGAMWHLANAKGAISVRPALFPFPDIRGNEELAVWQIRHQADYKKAAKCIEEKIEDGDLILAESAHQMNVYLPVVHGHLPEPSLREYRKGEKHYFTGSVLLRTSEDVFEFFRDSNQGKAKGVFIVLRGWTTYWSKTLYPYLDEKNLISEPGSIPVVYYLNSDELSKKFSSPLKN